MPITFLDTVEFSKIPVLNFVAPVVTSDPAPVAADEGRIIYNTTSNEVKYCRDNGGGGYEWVALGTAGAGAPPSGAAGGDLTGSYPSPQIATGVIVDADINASAAIAQSKIAGLGTTLGNKADTSRSLIAGAGLAGGGDLTTDRTFDVGAGTGITVSANDIAVNRTVTDTWYAAPGAASPPNGTASGDLSGTYPSPQIAAGVIVDADVNASAAIQQSKISGLTASLSGKADTTVDHIAGAGLTGGGTLAANRTFNVGAGTGITVNADDVAINTTYTDGRYLLLSGGTLTNFLTLHADPTAGTHAATKQYVDNLLTGLDAKASVKASTTANIANLAGGAPNTLDGISLAANDRVLVKDQTTPTGNGIYTVTTLGTGSNGTWTRATDMDSWTEVPAAYTWVEQGVANADSGWICTADQGGTLGSTSITWSLFSSATALIAGGGLIKTGNSIDVNPGNSTLTVSADTVVVASAPRWTTGQTIALTGDVTGTSAAWDGSAGISFATAIGSGVIVDADINASANIAQSKISGLGTSLTGKVDTTRSVIAGNGLTGGGTLASDATLNVVGDANLSVTADQVAVLSAPKWTTARTISLTGDATGSTSIDGSGNVSIATTVVSAGTAPKHYAANVGAGTAVVVNHALATRDVTVEVYRNSTPWDTITCSTERTDTNNVTLRFATAVAAGDYRVVVTGR